MLSCLYGEYNNEYKSAKWIEKGAKGFYEESEWTAEDRLQ